MRYLDEWWANVIQNDLSVLWMKDERAYAIYVQNNEDKEKMKILCSYDSEN